MKAALLWLATLTVALIELLVAVAVGVFFATAIFYMMIYMGSHGGIR